jgi:hypothetical protein
MHDHLKEQLKVLRRPHMLSADSRVSVHSARENVALKQLHDHLIWMATLLIFFITIWCLKERDLRAVRVLEPHVVITPWGNNWWVN